MSHPEVSYADAVAAIGTLPSLAPRPCATNIRALTINLVNKLTIVPSEQSADLGFSGLVEQDAVYALQTMIPWLNSHIRAKSPGLRHGDLARICKINHGINV